LKEELDKIYKLRDQIDAADVKIVNLLNRRAQFADEIGRLKRALNMPVYVPQREEQVIAHIQKVNKGPLSALAVRRLYERIIDESRRLEQENFEKRLRNTKEG